MSTAGGASIPPEQLKARYLGTGEYHIVKYLLEMGWERAFVFHIAFIIFYTAALFLFVHFPLF
jgi:hypothetical protein